MGLQQSVEHVFKAHGPLAKGLDGFTPRAGQVQMALAVAGVVEHGGLLAVEAGTGIGKTFAYLVPTLLSGEKVLLSTATKALQDQLFGRDIPRVLAALNLPARVALLKGRSSYLCQQRLEDARSGAHALDPSAMRELSRIEAWSRQTRSGDLAEVDGLDDRSSTIDLVTSTKDNCLGARCPRVQSCYVNLARRNAMAAEVIVINHHLFFADLNVRESGVAEILPSVQVVVFDEAHQLNDIGVQFLGSQLTTRQLAGLGSDLVSQGTRWARGVANWPLMALDIGRDIAALRAACNTGVRTGRRRWAGGAPQDIAAPAWMDLMGGLRRSLEEAGSKLQGVAQASPDLEALHTRVVSFLEQVERFSQPVQPGYVRWLEADSQVRLLEAPLDIAQTMQSKVFVSGGQPMGRRSWIFTSATLGSDAKMERFVESCGLKDVQLLQVESPFDYPRQAAIYIPNQMPRPADPSHSACVAMLAAEAAEVLEGRTLVLTTTLRAMHAIGDALRQYFDLTRGVEVLVQGQSSKRELLERFFQGAAHGSPGCILVACASFWEGVDIPGAALQLVVIDKLPFSPPNDPLVEARVQQMKASGKNAFQCLHVPQAAIALKQGAGRLIRSETDRGILVVCDVRLVQMAYGRKMLAALPAMSVLNTPDQFMGALRALTTPSTTDPCWT